MELWIRSQDKERLMKINSLNYVEYNDNYVINGYGTNECDNYDLGLYKTKERALEVLDEIQTQIVILNYQYIHRGEHFIATESNVYEMPKE